MAHPEQFPVITVAQCPLIPYYPITVIYGTDPQLLMAGAQTIDPTYRETDAPETIEHALRDLKQHRRAFRLVERLFFLGAREAGYGDDSPGTIHVSAKQVSIRWGVETVPIAQLPEPCQHLLALLLRWHAAPCLVCVHPEKLSSLLTSPTAYMQTVHDALKKPMVLFTKSRVFVQTMITTLPSLCQLYRLSE